ncbi:hypothetical protein HFN63_05565 [Rhizobium leguminosarum]|uniref:hypothetical protein n=1 Tax=Rhizobium leguminosarum TaxID=384 RepID=UPI001C96ABC4|nr:hypothetical protein [Rhizobium leguminosarum]MBY5769585.1 hypothetical protein [Rhizobium leguminosarum]
MPAYIEDNLNFANALAVLGVLLAYYFYVKAKLNYELLYTLVETTIVGDDNPRFSTDLKITYAGNEVPRVTSSVFAVWNGGNVTIKPEHFSPQSPLAFTPGVATKVLKVSILAQTRPENVTDTCWSGPPGTPVNVESLFIRPNEGFVCEVVHSGPVKELKIASQITEHGSRIREAKRIFGGETSGKGWLIDYIAYGFVLGFGPIFLAVGAAILVEYAWRTAAWLLGYGPVFDPLIEGDGSVFFRYPLAGAIACAVVIVLFLRDFYIAWRRRLPKELRPFLPSVMKSQRLVLVP